MFRDAFLGFFPRQKDVAREDRSEACSCGLPTCVGNASRAAGSRLHFYGCQVIHLLCLGWIVEKRAANHQALMCSGMSIVGMFLLNTFGPVLLKDMQAAH